MKYVKTLELIVVVDDRIESLFDFIFDLLFIFKNN